MDNNLTNKNCAFIALLKGVMAIVVLTGFAYTGFCETIVFKSGRIEVAPIIERNSQYIRVNFQGIPITYYTDDISTINGLDVSLSGSQEEAQLSNKNLNPAQVYSAGDLSIRLSIPLDWQWSIDKHTQGLVFSSPAGQGFGSIVITGIPYPFAEETGESTMLDLVAQAKKNSPGQVEIITFAGVEAVQSLLTQGGYMRELRFVKDGFLYTVNIMLDSVLFKQWGGVIEESLATLQTPNAEKEEYRSVDRPAGDSFRSASSRALENVAGSALYAIASAEYLYSNDHGSFASLEELMTEESFHIDKSLSAGQAMGYVYEVKADEQGFYAVAIPRPEEKLLGASFYIDEEGVLCKSLSSNVGAVNSHYAGDCPVGYGRLK